MANTQFLSGVSSIFVNENYVASREEVNFSLPMVIKNFAESNQGPLEDVLTWSKEAGQISFTMVHTVGLDYVALFTENDVFTVVINMRSGDKIVGTKCLLQEIPQQAAVGGTTELRFRTMNIEFDLAS